MGFGGESAEGQGGAGFGGGGFTGADTDRGFGGRGTPGGAPAVGEFSPGFGTGYDLAAAARAEAQARAEAAAAAQARSDYENRAERAGLANFGGTQYSPGAPLDQDFATYSSPQGLPGIAGQWGPMANNNYGSWANISPKNVAQDALAAASIAGSVFSGNLPGAAIGAAKAAPGIAGRNQGAMPSPGGYGGQSYDPSARGGSGPTGPDGTDPRLGDRPDATALVAQNARASDRRGAPDDSYARWVFGRGDR